MAEEDNYTKDGTVDYRGNPANKKKTGIWKACPYILRKASSESLNAKLNRSNVENPWFVFGISYPGALSAWFRLKFPHLTCGSLASSKVVLAVYNFIEFDQQIGLSAGPECKAALQEVNQLVEQKHTMNGQALKALFAAAEINEKSATCGWKYANQGLLLYLLRVHQKQYN
ncbi:putative serine protease eda2 [Sarracenia purpurea var. burkii]